MGRRRKHITKKAPTRGDATCRYNASSYMAPFWNNVTSGSLTAAMTSTVTAWPTFPGNVAQYTSVANNAELQAISNCTLEVWVKYSAVGGHQCIFGKWAHFGGITSTGTALTFYDPGGTATRSTGFVLGNGTWYHIALCCTNGAPGSATAYVNGTAVVTAAWTKATTYTFGLIVGQFPGFWPLNGLVDEARLYSRALSLDEVKRNYYAGLGRHQ